MWPRELIDLDQRHRVAGRRASLAEQRDGAVSEAGEPSRLGRLPQQPGAPLAVGGEPPGPLERRGRGRVRAAVPAAGACLLERRRRCFVRAGRRGGEMPGAAVDVPVGQGGGERPVRVAALAGGRIGVDRRPGQRMAELHHARVQRDQPCALRGGKRRQVDPEPGRGPLQRRQIAGVAGRGQDQGLPGGLVEQAGSLQERARDPGGDKDGGAFGSERQLVCVRCELEQRKRVAGRRLVQPPGRFRRQPRHEHGRLVAGQAADPQRRQVGAVEQ